MLVLRIETYLLHRSAAPRHSLPPSTHSRVDHMAFTVTRSVRSHAKHIYSTVPPAEEFPFYGSSFFVISTISVPIHGRVSVLSFPA